MEKHLASRARVLAAGRPVLYHGTRRASEVLKSGKLAPLIYEAVALTRSAEIAAYFALTPHLKAQRYSAAILVLNAVSLKHAYKIEPFHDPCWDKQDHRYDEQEERIVGRIVSFRRHLIGVARITDLQLNPETKLVEGLTVQEGESVKRAQWREVRALRCSPDSALHSDEYDWC